AQKQWCSLSREQILAPAIQLADSGFRVSDALAYSLKRAAGRFQTDQTKAYFLGKDFAGFNPGELWVQPDLANTLKTISERGVDGFYSGKTAERIVDQIRHLGGTMTLADLAGYEAIVREPVRGSYRDYEIASMPPPSSGGVHLVQMLNILENTDLQTLEHNSSGYLHLLVEAMKPAYADRSRHLGDPNFVQVPVNRLISKDYAAELWGQIDPRQVRPSEDISPFSPVSEESTDTTHFSVWDTEGNVVSNTYTLNFSYGNGIAVAGAGFLLNNEMDDFSARPGDANAYELIGSEANAIEPGKRPLSSMTPTIVFKGGKPFMATGSPGGSRIITTVLQSVLNVVDHSMNAAEAVSVPRIHHQWQPDQIYWESGISADTRNVMENWGHHFDGRPRTFAKLEVILKTESGLQGASDPRWPKSGAVVEPEPVPVP
ncbi:MAG: gamma-glutamyltransferase, partial [Pseudohongiellaceae bacterium]